MSTPFTRAITQTPRFSKLGFLPDQINANTDRAGRCGRIASHALLGYTSRVITCHMNKKRERGPEKLPPTEKFLHVLR